MSNKRLLIASPAKGKLPLYYPVLIEQLLRNPIDGWDVEWMVEAANAAIGISRSVLANAAITRNFDRVLQLDLDEPVGRKHVERILSHDHDEYDIVSGLYCIKRPGKPFWLGMALPGASPNEKHLLEAAFLPTGFLSESVRALKRMQEFHKDREVYIQDDVLLPPGPRPENSTFYDLFPLGAVGPRTPSARLKKVRAAMKTVMDKEISRCTRADLLTALHGVVTALTEEGKPGNFLGEDYTHSLLARQAGIRLWIDVACMVPHEGSITFPIIDPGVVATTIDRVPEPVTDVFFW